MRSEECGNENTSENEEKRKRARRCHFDEIVKINERALLAEMNSPRVSLFFSNDHSYGIPFKRKGVFETYFQSVSTAAARWQRWHP